MISGRPGRRVLGYVSGTGGKFGRAPFYELRLERSAAEALDQVLNQSNSAGRCTVTVTTSFHQPDRLRILEADPPEYEARLASTYVRGDALRVHGREGVSCGLDLTARWGVPALRAELQRALGRASREVLLRVPSRKRNVVEFVPDVDLRSGEEDAILSAAAAGAAQLLPAEDFSDWEK